MKVGFIVGGCAMVLAGVLRAEDYYVLTDATDWSLASSYTNAAGATPGGAL